jgi:hypothetical protein
VEEETVEAGRGYVDARAREWDRVNSGTHLCAAKRNRQTRVHFFSFDEVQRKPIETVRL